MKKNIVFTIVFCLILKSSAFAIGMEAAIGASSPVIQSAVFEVISVMEMPFQAVAKLMKEMPLFNEANQPLQGKSDKKENHSQDTKCLLTLDPKEAAKPKLKAISTSHSFASISQALSHNMIVSSKVLYSPWDTLICMIVMTFLILLPRRGLPWDSSILTRVISPNYGSAVIGFFNLGLNESIRPCSMNNNLFNLMPAQGWPASGRGGK